MGFLGLCASFPWEGTGILLPELFKSCRLPPSFQSSGSVSTAPAVVDTQPSGLAWGWPRSVRGKPVVAPSFTQPPELPPEPQLAALNKYPRCLEQFLSCRVVSKDTGSPSPLCCFCESESEPFQMGHQGNLTLARISRSQKATAAKTSP